MTPSGRFRNLNYPVFGSWCHLKKLVEKAGALVGDLIMLACFRLLD